MINTVRSPYMIISLNAPLSARYKAERARLKSLKAIEPLVVR